MSRFAKLVEAAERQHGLVTRDQLEEAGYTPSGTRNLLMHGHLEPVRRGLCRLPGTPDSWHGALMAVCLAAKGVLASHRSACRLWGMRSCDDDIDVSIGFPRSLNIPGARVHRSRDLSAGDWSWVDGVPVTSPVRTLCDAGLVFPEHEVGRMLDHAVATELVTRRDLWRFRFRVGRQGRNGCGVLGRLLADLPAVAGDLESGVEVALSRVIENHDLPLPVYQHPVVGRGSRYRLDAAYPAWRVLIEVDGVDSHSEPRQIAADGGRQNDLVTAGWTPLRFTWSDIRDRPASVASVIRRNLPVRGGGRS
jgi:very-short-patch-repair endonuclease